MGIADGATSIPVGSVAGPVPGTAVVTYSGAKGDLVWSEPDCYDCSGCIGVCPFHALENRFGTIIADMDRCTLCTLCERVCPTAAFTINRAPSAPTPPGR